LTLHSYRYASVERAKSCGYPERFAREALGHNRKPVHRAHTKRVLMKIPSLEEYEQRGGGKGGTGNLNNERVQPLEPTAQPILILGHWSLM